MDRDRGGDRTESGDEQTIGPLPGLVQLIAWLHFVWAALLVLTIVVLWQGFSERDSQVGFLWFEFDGRRDALVLLVIAVAETVLALVIGVGLLRRSEIARVSAIVGYILNAVLLLVTTLADPVTGAVLLGVLVSIGLVAYLSLPAVRDHFV